MFNNDDVKQCFADWWPSSSKLTPNVISEIAQGLNDAGGSISILYEAIKLFRKTPDGMTWPPDGWLMIKPFVMRCIPDQGGARWYKGVWLTGGEVYEYSLLLTSPDLDVRKQTAVDLEAYRLEQLAKADMARRVPTQPWTGKKPDKPPFDIGIIARLKAANAGNLGDCAE